MKFLFFLVTMLPQLCISQTCIVIVATQNEIIVGADTRMVRTVEGIDSKGKKRLIEIVDTTCKILKAGKIFYSVAGIVPKEIDDLVKNSCIKSNRVKEAGDQFIMFGESQIKKYYDRERTIHKEFWERNFSHFQAGIGVLFYAFEDGLPKFYKVEFRVASSINEPVVLTSFIDVLLEYYPRKDLLDIDRTAIGQKAAIVKYITEWCSKTHFDRMRSFAKDSR